MPGNVASTDPRRWIVAAGPLEKAKPENAFRSGWGKRYFVLTHSHIFWFKKDDPYEELFGAERNKLKVADLLGGEEGISARTGADGWEEIVIRTRLPSKADALVLCRTRNAAVAAEWVAVVRAVQEEMPAKRFMAEAPRESSGSFAADNLDVSDDDQEPTTPTTTGGAEGGGGGGAAAAAAAAAPPGPASPAGSPMRSIKRSGSYKLKSSGSFSGGGGGGHLVPVLQVPVLGQDGKLAGCSICDVANNTGISAIGYLQKSRDGAIRSGWSTRLFVLARRSLYYFKVPDAHAELFGEERGRLPLVDVCGVYGTAGGAELPEGMAPVEAGGEIALETLSKGIMAHKAAPARIAHRVNELVDSNKTTRRVTLRGAACGDSALAAAWVQLLGSAALDAGSQAPSLRRASETRGAEAAAAAVTAAAAPAAPSANAAASAAPAAPAVPASTAAAAAKNKEKEQSKGGGGGVLLGRMTRVLGGVGAVNGLLHAHVLVPPHAWNYLVCALSAAAALWIWLASVAAAKAEAVAAAKAARLAAAAIAAAAAAPKLSLSGGAAAKAAKAAAPRKKGGKPTLGTTLAQHSLGAAVGPAPQNTWSRGVGTSFNVRCGPNYKKNGKKAPSAEEMYETLSLDLVRAERKLEGFQASCDLPEGWWGAEQEAACRGPLPPLLVINVQVPFGAPKMMGSSDDTSGISIVVVMRIKPSTQAHMAELEAAGGGSGSGGGGGGGGGGEMGKDAAYRLLMRWMRDAGTAGADVKLKERLKAMGVVSNMGELGLGSFIESYNGKPVLITKSGTITRGEVVPPGKPGGKPVPCTEITIDVHRWAYVPRRGLHSLKERFSDMAVNIGLGKIDHADLLHAWLTRHRRCFRSCCLTPAFPLPRRCVREIHPVAPQWCKATVMRKCRSAFSVAGRITSSICSLPLICSVERRMSESGRMFPFYHWALGIDSIFHEWKAATALRRWRVRCEMCVRVRVCALAEV